MEILAILGVLSLIPIPVLFIYLLVTWSKKPEPDVPAVDKWQDEYMGFMK